jgi:hypothetical protein
MPARRYLRVMSYTVIVAGLVSAAVAGIAQFLNSRFLFEYQLQRQYAQEERKKLRELIGRYKGRILEASLDWHRRMVQIYDGTYDYLSPPDGHRLHEQQYYYQSVVFRFLQLMGIARQFEAEAFYINGDVAKDSDFDLLRYTKSFLWVMIHPELSPDDGQPGLDHFRSDSFRPLLDLCYSTAADGGNGGGSALPETRRNGHVIFDRQRCMALLRQADAYEQRTEIAELLGFFDGLCPDDRDKEHDDKRFRRRWDRLVALHLFVLAFILKSGYSWQTKGLGRHITQAAQMLLYPEALESELDEWLPKLGLAKDMRLVKRELTRAAALVPPNEDDTARQWRVRELTRASR